MRSLLLTAAVLTTTMAGCAEDHGKYGRGEVADDVEFILPGIGTEVDCDDEDALFPEGETVTCPVLDADDDAGGGRIGEVDMVREGDVVSFTYRPDDGEPVESNVTLDDISDF